MPTEKPDQLAIDYKLTFTTLFHCGTGMRIGLIDRAVKRDGAGYLYVPGATIKGVLREHCERLARFYSTNEEAKALVASPHEAEAALRGLGRTRPTMVTRIFGSQTVPGQLFFDDARLSAKDQDEYERSGSTEKQGEQRDRRASRSDYKGLQVEAYTQVRLDRPTRTAVEGALYTSEFGSKDMSFEGSILGWLDCTALETAEVQNARHPETTPTYSLLLLLAGLGMIERLGGNKSTGKGRCTCEVTSVKLNDYEVAEDVWRHWFEHLDELASYQQEG